MSPATYSMSPEQGRDLARISQQCLMVGIGALILSAVGALFSPGEFFRSYLVAFVFWVGVPLGSMAIMMLHHLSGGGWGLVIRRILECATRTFPVLVLLFLPLLLGLPYLYEWMHSDIVAKDEVLKNKAVYLNAPFFILRAAMYFASWLVFAFLLNKWSLRQDSATGEAHRENIGRRLQLLSGPGLLVYGATVTLAVVDWIMSLDPHWYSTIYGLIFIAAQGISALCLVIAVVVILVERGPLTGVIKASHLHDFGKLLLAFVMLWAYFNFSQFLIIWSGNLPEEIPYYLKRFEGVWRYIGLFLVIFHFALPFILLLSRDLKRSGRSLTRVAILIICMRIVDLIWQIAPNREAHAAFLPWMYVLTPVALGGIWLWMFTRQLNKRPLLPLGDPHLKEVLADGGH